jgi:AraC-like DNA-binding protein
MPEYYIERENSSLSEYGIEFFLQIHSHKGYTAKAHIHPAIEMIYITGGKYLISVDNEEMIATCGDLLFFRANTIHSIRLVSEESGSYYVLKINPSLLFHIFPGREQMKLTSPFLLKKRDESVLFYSHQITDNFKEIFDKMIASLEKDGERFLITERALASLLLIEMLGNMLPEYEGNTKITEKNVSLIYECVDYVNNNYASDISAEECANMLHVSYSYFARLFHAVMGKTFKEYLISVRLAKAKSILLSTSIPITDVAIACGYTNFSYFIAEYKKAFGKTPKQSRKDIYG